ncbi:MAG TPA: aminodeoxychorismate/anthranilate synthase component II [Bacteroidales bacterium]|nr:aminodeoxychorismate/anthranilate synthase component II [Bacteroidales bacterium]
MAKILVFDNYDSFTYNLVHYVHNAGNNTVDTVLNDKIQLSDVEEYDGIILSPGPGLPSESGLLKPLIERYASSKRIFGVCLGLQAIAEVFGGSLVNLSTVYHGIATPVTFRNPVHYLFRGIPLTINAGRYHSWVVDEKTLPGCFNIEATDDSGLIMSLSHKEYDICGVQFHPESVLTPFGLKIISNWLEGFGKHQ